MDYNFFGDDVRWNPSNFPVFSLLNREIGRDKLVSDYNPNHSFRGEPGSSPGSPVNPAVPGPLGDIPFEQRHNNQGK